MSTSMRFTIVICVNKYLISSCDQSTTNNKQNSCNMSLSSKPEFNKLTECLDPLIGWEKFGTYLPGIKSEHLQQIQEDHQGIDRQKRALYNKWLAIYPEASWQDVINALKTAQENTLAAEIPNKISATRHLIATQIQGKTSTIHLYIDF